jgi:hypothetical protein
MNTIYSTLALLVSLATSVQAQDTSVHQSNAGIGNLAAVRFDGSGETGQRQRISYWGLWRVIH